jgi:hypothetical protein
VYATLAAGRLPRRGRLLGLLRRPVENDNAAMEAESPTSEPPKRKGRWFRRIALLLVLPTACIVVLLRAADRYAVIIPVTWTAFWMNASVRAGRQLKRDPERARAAESRRALPKWLSIPLKALGAFWFFGSALFVGLAWGAVAGLASLYLELFAAAATVFISGRIATFCESNDTTSLTKALFIRLGFARH